MKNFSLKILPTAKKDIQGILDYIAIDLCAPVAALNLQNKILSAFSTITKFPFSGTLAKTVIPLSDPLRWVRAENYLIYYTISEDEESIYITRVRFASSDQTKL